MTITTKTTIAFKIPDEEEKRESFLKANKGEKWKEDYDSSYWYYTLERRVTNGK